jgi:hypothetical protein
MRASEAGRFNAATTTAPSTPPGPSIGGAGPGKRVTATMSLVSGSTFAVTLTASACEREWRQKQSDPTFERD